jgi:flavodoxin
MKTMVVYSSKTGNTKMVAESIMEIMPPNSEIYHVKDAPDPEDYDFIALGCWVDKGKPDEAAKDYFKKVKDTKVGIFITLGAKPDSKHGKESVVEASELLIGNEVIGQFVCQGKIDPKLIEMFRKFPAGHPHAPTPESEERWRVASTHPDKNDLNNAKVAFKQILSRLKEEST